MGTFGGIKLLGFTTGASDCPDSETSAVISNIWSVYMEKIGH